MNKDLLKQFENPSNEFRAKPFWAWNGKLEPEELRRQIRVMDKMGLGGFFMHSRVGLDTAYLSDEWFECIDACIDEAEKLDMEAWLYDEDRWPSGAAGGLVTKNPKYRMRFLIMEETTKPADLKWTKDVLGAFTAKINKTDATDVVMLKKGRKLTKLEKGKTILIFREEIMECDSWYNGFTYLDTMDHEAVQEFIRVTYDPYLEHNGKHFGKRIPGMFTDEPNYKTVESFRMDNSMPWTRKLLQVFKKRYCYDLRNHLMEIYFDIDGKPMTPARLDYHDCLTFCFVDAFSRQCAEWCEKNKLLLTGHCLWEELLSSITRSTGSCMRFFEHMQAPGMDLLTQHKREYDTAKQVSSVARQFGRKYRLTETYGCTGWDFPLSGHKALSDWQAALGINLRCQHLSWYTMEGEAKRDYPAGIFYQSPWWEIYSKVEDYYARINVVMTQGEEVRDLLVIHPIESLWALCKKNWFARNRTAQDVNECDASIVEVRDALLSQNIDFDYGDEDMLARHAKVIKKDGPALKMGKAAYKAIVVPPMITMRKTTLELLKKFRKAGGVVVFAGGAANYMDGVESCEVVEFARDCVSAPAKGKGIPKTVDPLCRRMSITDAKGKELVAALSLLREDKDAFYLFVCNVGHDYIKSNLGPLKDLPVRDRTAVYPDVTIKGFEGCSGAPLEFDPDSGDVFAADAKVTRAGVEIKTSFAALGSRLFIIPKKKDGAKPAKRKQLKDVRKRDLGKGKWDVLLSECNNLVLDRPKCRIDGGKWRDADEILRVDRKVRDALGIQHRGGQMVQPWAQKFSKKLKKVSVELAYSFMAKALPTGDLFVAVERPDTFAICVNGTPISMAAESGWWTDLSLRKIPVNPALLRVGENEITMLCEYDETHPGLEIVYLLGSFGTEAKGTDVTVTKMPTELKIGDWVKQGLAFYSGSTSYVRQIKPNLKKGERMFVQVPAYEGSAVRVLVDGKAAGVIAWEPNEVDITDFITGDTATLGIEVIGHRRNSHGPLHLADKKPMMIGPPMFTTSGADWKDDYQLVPCGLMKAPVLVVRK